MDYQELIKRLRQYPDDSVRNKAADAIEQLQAELAVMTEKRNNLRNTIFTNTNREMSLNGRFFRASADWVYDENFDFDAGFKLFGDFVDDEKNRYAQMIACTLNDYQNVVAELAAIKAENESLKKDAELWCGYQKRKQDLLDRGFLRSPLRADELDATTQGEKG